MDMAFKSGLMVQFMKDNGKTIELMVMVSSPISMVMSIVVSGLTIEQMAMVSTITSTAHATRVTGSQTCSTVKVKKVGQMGQCMKVNT